MKKTVGTLHCIGVGRGHCERHPPATDPIQYFELCVYGYGAASVVYAGTDRSVPAAHWSISITNPAIVHVT